MGILILFVMQSYNANPIQNNYAGSRPYAKMTDWPKTSYDNAEQKGIMSLMIKYKTELATWAAFGFVTIQLAYLFSDLSFSAIATLASGFQILSYALIILKIHATATVNSLSQQTFILTMSALFLRLISTTQFNGYLPVDRSGDWLIQTCDALSFIAVALAVYLSKSRYHQTIPKDQDKLLAVYLGPVAFVLAPFLKANLNHNWLADNCWMTSLMLETVANMPQVVLLSQQDEEVEGLTGHYLAAQGISKILNLCFWASSYKELIVAGSSAWSSGSIVAAYGIQVLVLGDFLYYYFKSMSSNTRIVINDMDLL